MKREAWASQTTATSNFVCWPCTMPISRHSYEEPYFLRCYQSWQGKYAMQGITELFHTWATKSFCYQCSRWQKVFEKIRGIRQLVLAEYGLY